jgi:hypothetical protein
VGQGAREEIDRVLLGGNYGWPIREGMTCYQAATCNTAGLVDPVVDYPHPDGIAVTGGYVYRGAAIPELAGKLVFADFTSVMWLIDYDPVTGKPSRVPLDQPPAGTLISALAQDNAGEIYVVDWNIGQVLLVTRAGGSPPPSTFPQKLSQTGCVDPMAPTHAAAGVIPYGVAASEWLEGASVERGFAIPDGKTIHVGTDGDWDLPARSVAMQTLSVGGKRVETRLLARHDDGHWAGYSYAWATDESDATLVAGDATRAIAGAPSPWYFPMRAECVGCHSSAPGGTLGLETRQLDSDFTYANGVTQNQLAALTHVNIFDVAPVSSPSSRLVSPSGSAPLSARAASYLHANCSACHRPDVMSGMDLRFGAPSMKACGVAPVWDLGVTNALLIAPGDPTRSVVSLRAHAIGAHAMPLLGGRTVDVAGTKVVDDWIASLATCP